MGKFNYKGLMKPTDKRYNNTIYVNEDNVKGIQITGWKKNPNKLDIKKVREALLGLAKMDKEEKAKEKK